MDFNSRVVEKRKNKRPYKIDDFSDCKVIPEVADTSLMLYRSEFYWPEKEDYHGWMQVIPVVMRVGDKKEKSFKLGVDMATSKMSDWKWA